MRRMLLLLVAAALTLLCACERTPPSPKVEWKPGDRTVTAGEAIELRATKPLTHEKEAFEYTWTMTGDCAGQLADPTAWKVTYDVPADCGGGELTFQLSAKTRLGTTTESVTFQLSPRPQEEIGLQPVRPSPLPTTWEFVNDYDGTVGAEDQQRRNKRGGYFGTWTYRDGKCELAQDTAEGSGVMKLSYVLPHNDLSACGYFEYFDGPPGDAKRADVSGFAKAGFIARSATGEPVHVRLELVEFDKYANYNQGIVSESEPFLVDDQWRRHEIDLKKLAATWKLSSAKSIGFRIDAKDDNPGKGIVLIDNLVLIRPERSTAAAQP